MNWVIVGKMLIIAGVALAAVGLFFLLADKLPLGRLPGDFRFGGDKFRVYIPLATCALLSVLLTIIVNLFLKK
jgi:hypothetical protein